MRLDHVSYVASHDQISDVVNRIGSQIGTAFIDGGIHPKFGTRNFTAPLLHGQYIEVVCPLDHPATESTPFGKAVKRKANEGGGWFAWVISASDISTFEKNLKRSSVEGQRTKPDHTVLSWRQLGVTDTDSNGSLPYFVKWENGIHPSLDGLPHAELSEIKINGDIDLINQWIQNDIRVLTQDRSNLKLSIQKKLNFDSGIESVCFSTQHALVEIK
jgi:hypothetical protein